ncbi:MAG: hypothetical protein JXA11_14885 [Phycisphaerae bacterium]|nr:hypothetical protein [Phycisphaerae bacterium]
MLPVTAVAGLAFVLPVRREMIVGSLALWRRAADSLATNGSKSTRQVPPGWLLLLSGAVLAVLATAGPVLNGNLFGKEQSPAKSSPAETPQITFDALAGETRPDGRAELFVRLRNHREQSFIGSLTISSSDETEKQAVSLTIPPRETFRTVRIAPDAPTLNVRVINNAGKIVAAEELRKTQPGLTRLAVMGDVGGVLQRYIQSDARLALVPSAEKADVVLAQGTLPPKGVPALLLAPPTPPPGRREGEHQFAVTLGKSDVAADDPVMKDVNVAAMAIRRVPLWRPEDATIGKVLLHTDGQAIIVRSAPEKHREQSEPRRVYVSFAITRDNTNMEEIPGPFVTLLANAIRWLHPADDVRGQFVRQEAPTSEKTRLKVPRLKTRLAASVELAPWLIVAAMLCWILGWWRYGRVTSFSRGGNPFPPRPTE